MRNPQAFEPTLKMMIPTKNPIKKASTKGDGLLLCAASSNSLSDSWDSSFWFIFSLILINNKKAIAFKSPYTYVNNVVIHHRI